MKFLLVLAVLVIAFYVWRSGRRDEDPSNDAPPRKPPRPGTDPARPQDMVRCAACAVHLPRGDALPGPDGATFYCSEQHRANARR